MARYVLMRKSDPIEYAYFCSEYKGGLLYLFESKTMLFKIFSLSTQMWSTNGIVIKADYTSMEGVLDEEFVELLNRHPEWRI